MSNLIVSQNERTVLRNIRDRIVYNRDLIVAVNKTVSASNNVNSPYRSIANPELDRALTLLSEIYVSFQDILRYLSELQDLTK